MANIGQMPQIAIPRSRFRQDFTHTTSWQHGFLFPIDCFEVIAGDDYSVHKAAAEIHMSQPIAPIFGNIKMKVCAFFVPMRLVWEHTEEFFGANKTSYGPQTTTYKIPGASIFSYNIGQDSLSHYLGKPVCTQDYSKVSYGKVSVLKERAYYLIWNEWFRNQQLQNPVIVNKSDVGMIGTDSGQMIGLNWQCKQVNKQVDYFTQAVISPQYGSAVSLPLGTYAPVVAGPTGSDHNLSVNGSTIHLFKAGTSIPGGTLGTGSGNGTGANELVIRGTSLTDDGTIPDRTNLMADLSAATAAKINDIRYAFQLQKYLERANYGTRFFEVLAVHYGISSPDARLQRPEYLGGKSSPIVIRTVLSTAGYDAGNTQKVGAPGASSITTIDLSGLFSKGFVEPGYVFVLGFNNHERLYSQGIMREDSKFDRFEFYSPEFANLGDQEVLNQELFVSGTSADTGVFGYVGHWDEYRYRKNLVSGLMDPAVTGALDFWTLADEFNSTPVLNETFIKENRDSISRCLVTGATGPDYIGDFYIEYAGTRELPLYNIPGLVDHFGAL